MIIDIKVPVLAESVSEASVMAWEKAVGEAVAADEKLVDLETDKVVLEVIAPQAGRLTEILCDEDSVVESEQVLARIDTDAVTAATAEAASAAAEEPASADSESPKTSPAVRKIAAEQGRDPAEVPHDGDRVTKADMLASAPAAAAAAAPEPAPVAEAPKAPAPAPAPAPVAPPAAPVSKAASEQVKGRPQERVAMTRLRRRASERLLQAQHHHAILTTFNEVNMKPVMDLRKSFKGDFEKAHGVKLGFMSFFVKAAVAALQKFPILNASTEGTDILYHGFYDIGIAVSSPRGLVVPILRDADQLSFAGIEKGIADLGQKARDGKLAMSDLEGGTFSITNGGIFGSMLSTPILNPPQSAILGMHNIVERPMVENGEVVVRPVMYLAMSYDHRIIDGRDAVQGLVEMKRNLEDPSRLLLDV